MTEVKNCNFVGEQGAIEVFNVRDYDAVGDQKTDDSAALQRAFNAATLSGGGKVYCPSGVYCLSRRLRLDGSWWVRLWLWLKSFWPQ